MGVPWLLKNANFPQSVVDMEDIAGLVLSQHGSRDMVALLKASTVTQGNCPFRFLPNPDSFAPRIHNMSTVAAMLTVNSRFLKSVTVGKLVDMGYQKRIQNYFLFLTCIFLVLK